MDWDDISHLAPGEQSRFAPIADRVEAPGTQTPDRRITPNRQVIGTVFSLQIGGVEVETPSVTELPAPLFGQAAAFIRVAVVRGERTSRIGKLGEHGFPSLDKSRPDIGADDIDAEGEKTVALRCHEPPAVIPSLRAKEPRRTKIRSLQQPAIAIQPEGWWKPLAQLQFLAQSCALEVLG